MLNVLIDVCVGGGTGGGFSNQLPTHWAFMIQLPNYSVPPLSLMFPNSLIFDFLAIDILGYYLVVFSPLTPLHDTYTHAHAIYGTE